MSFLHPPYNRTLAGAVAGVLGTLLLAAVLQRYIQPLPVLAVGFIGLHLASSQVQQSQGVRRRAPRTAYLLYGLGQVSLCADFLTQATMSRHGYGVLIGAVGAGMLVLLLLQALLWHSYRPR